MKFQNIYSALHHFNHGVVLTSQPLQDDELFEVRLDSKVPRWYGSLQIGATTVSPGNLFPSTITSITQGETYALIGDEILSNGKDMAAISKDLHRLAVCYTLMKKKWNEIMCRECLTSPVKLIRIYLFQIAEDTKIRFLYLS